MQTAPHFYLTLSIDTTKLAELRATINEYAETLPEPVKVSINDLIVKGVALALVRVPQVNVSFDGERLLFKKHINVGVAVALEQGLIVPVIRDADKRGVLDLARESRRLVDAARTGKLKPEEFQGGTFSVSNLGMFEIEEIHGGHQSAGVGDPGRRRDPAHASGDGRTGRRARPHEGHALGGSPRAGRRHRRALPAGAQAAAGVADGPAGVALARDRSKRLAGLIAPPAVSYLSLSCLDVQIPDGLTAAGYVCLKRKCEIMLAGGYLVWHLPLQQATRLDFPVRWREVRKDSFCIFLSCTVLHLEAEQTRDILLGLRGILDGHIHHKERVATLGLGELIALGSLHGIYRHDEGIADLHLIAHFEMLLSGTSQWYSLGSRRTAIRISAPARQDRQRQSHQRADGGEASETRRLLVVVTVCPFK